MQTITNIFIHNLARYDILVETLINPLWAASLYKGTWNLIQERCDVTATLQLIMDVTSMLNMGLIALNRYLKVV